MQQPKSDGQYTKAGEGMKIKDAAPESFYLPVGNIYDELEAKSLWMGVIL